MTRITRAAGHLSAEEVKHRMQTDPHPWWRLHWLIIYNALVDPRKAEEIAKELSGNNTCKAGGSIVDS